MSFLFNHEMDSITRLFNKRNDLYRELLRELKEKDVKTDSDFNTTVWRIKNAVLLEPVKIEEPKIVDHHGDGRFYISLHVPFSGSAELFSHVPKDVWTDDDLPKLQPGGNYIPVEVELFRLDKTLAISAAKEQLEDTRIFIEANNKQVIEWRSKMDATIDSDLDRRRSEILALYS